MNTGNLAREIVRVLVVDDSPFVCRLLASHFESARGFTVAGSAFDGQSAVDMVEELQPDLVTLDLEMPGMNGLEALEVIMSRRPTPVILISGISRRAADMTMQALDIGAVDFILKYTPGVNIDPEALRREIIAKARAASQIKVIRYLRGPQTRNTGSLIFPFGRGQTGDLTSQASLQQSLPRVTSGIVVIGASTGGPMAIKKLLGNLPPDFADAILVVQHMPAAFTRVLAEQLNRSTPLKVKEAEVGDRPQPGLVLVAPGDYHLLVGPDLKIELSKGPTIAGHRPSVDVTMQSVAQVYGYRARGILLTGMGSDGAMGMVAIKSKGGRTFAQDEESSVVNGMPQRAIEQGVVDCVAPPEQIARMIAENQPKAKKEKVC